MKLLLLTLTLLLLGFSSVKQNNPDDFIIKLRQEALAKIDILACLDEGGTIQKVCLLGVPACVKKYADAGMQCSDSSECEGECILERAFVQEGTETTGLCSYDNDTCGCSQKIANGLASHAVCMD